MIAPLGTVLVATDLADGMLDFHGEGILRRIPLGRVGTPEEVAALAVYLVSDEASYITGEKINVWGGGEQVSGMA